MGLAGLPVEGPTRTTASYKMTPFTPRAPRRGSRLFNLSLTFLNLSQTTHNFRLPTNAHYT